MKKPVPIYILYVFFITAGLLLTAIVQFLDDGLSKIILVVTFSLGFIFFFLWLNIRNVHTLLEHGELKKTSTLFISFNLTILIFVFAIVYSITGILDKTSEGSRIIHYFDICLYYSVVTFTTLGYGDYFPVGIGRAVAAIEALTGFVVLGLIASTAISVISKKTEES